MSAHRGDFDAAELITHFTTVIDWARSVVPGKPDKTFKALDWGGLWVAHHAQPYDGAKVRARFGELMADPAVSAKKGIVPFILGGETDTALLSVRLFSDTVKATAYAAQTEEASAKGVSNCPLCAVGTGPNAIRLYAAAEMEADHVAAWSKGGASAVENCQMLCKTHNAAKGNR